MRLRNGWTSSFVDLDPVDKEEVVLVLLGILSSVGLSEVDGWPSLSEKSKATRQGDLREGGVGGESSSSSLLAGSLSFFPRLAWMNFSISFVGLLRSDSKRTGGQNTTRTRETCLLAACSYDWVDSRFPRSARTKSVHSFVLSSLFSFHHQRCCSRRIFFLLGNNAKHEEGREFLEGEFKLFGLLQKRTYSRGSFLVDRQEGQIWLGKASLGESSVGRRKSAVKKEESSPISWEKFKTKE